MLEFEKVQKEMGSDSDKKEEKQQRLAKKMHSLYFPFSWTEIVTNSFNIMMLNGEAKNSDEA